MSSLSSRTPLPHQQRVVNHLVDNSHRGLICAHDVGTGKTYTAISCMHALLQQYPDMQCIVLLSLSIKAQFQQETLTFLTPDLHTRVHFYTYQYFVNLYNKQNEEIKQILPNSFLIIDEAHNLRTEIVQEANQGSRAATILRASMHAQKILLLTATMIYNTPYDAYNLIAMIDKIPPEQQLGKLQFQEAYVKYKADFEALIKCKISYHTYSVSVHHEVNNNQTSDFPRLIHAPNVALEMSQSYYEKYKAIEQKNFDTSVLASFNPEIEKFGTSYESDDSYACILRQACNAIEGEESPKFKYLKEFLVEKVAQGEKCIVFTNWRPAGIDLMKMSLMDTDIWNQIAIIHGDIDANQRDLNVKQYNNDELKVLLITTKAGGEGLNLLGTRHVVLFEPNWNKATDDQLIGRAVRCHSHSRLPADQRTVTVHRLIMKKPANTIRGKSIDEEMLKVAYEKKDPMNQSFVNMLKQHSIESTASLLSSTSTECNVCSKRGVISLQSHKFKECNRKKRKIEEEQLIKVRTKVNKKSKVDVPTNQVNDENHAWLCSVFSE
jgi:SNF2 family DNA or RNA helicase